MKLMKIRKRITGRIKIYPAHCKVFKKIIFSFFYIFLFTIFFYTELRANALKEDLIILSYGGERGKFWKNINGEGGYPAVARKIAELKQDSKAKGGELLLLHTGLWSAEKYYPGINSYLPSLIGLNRLGLDAAIFSPEDFNIPLADLQDFLRRKNFPLLASNLEIKSAYRFALNKKTRPQKYIIINKGGLKIGIMAFINPETFSQKNKLFSYFRFLPLFQTAEKISAFLKKEGCNVIIALSSNPSSVKKILKPPALYSLKSIFSNTYNFPEKKYTFNSEYLRDLNNVDLLITNSSLKVMSLNSLKGRILNFSPRHEGLYLNKIDLHFLYSKLIGVQQNYIPINVKFSNTNTIADNRTLFDALNKYRKPDEEKILCDFPFSLKVNQNLLTDSDLFLPDFLAKAIRKKSSTDIVLFPSSLIRADLTKGKIYIKDIRKSLPFAYPLVSLELYGYELRSLIQRIINKQGNFSVFGKAGLSFKIVKSAFYKKLSKGKDIGKAVSNNFIPEKQKDKLTVKSDSNAEKNSEIIKENESTDSEKKKAANKVQNLSSPYQPFKLQAVQIKVKKKVLKDYSVYTVTLPAGTLSPFYKYPESRIEKLSFYPLDALKDYFLTLRKSDKYK